MERTEKIARHLVDLIPDSELNSDLWKYYQDIKRRFKIYFDFLDLTSVIIIFLKILSLKKTGDLSFYDKIRNRIFFVGFFSSNGASVFEECDDCGGDGRQNCADCDGQGFVSCENCDGSGTIDCDNCGGGGVLKQSSSGESEEISCDECDGQGFVSCENCDEGTAECNYCRGRGDFFCEDCDGRGEIETEKKEYTEELYLSWDKNLYEYSLLNLGTYIGLEEVFYDDLVNNNQTMLINYSESEGIVNDDVKENLKYSFFLSDDPKDLSGELDIKKSSNSKLKNYVQD